MRSGLGYVIQGLGYLTWAIFGIWGLILSLAIVNAAAGFWGVVVGFFLFPVTFTAAPLYAVVAWGNWFPLLISYGGGIAGLTLAVVGSVISEGNADLREELLASHDDYSAPRLRRAFDDDDDQTETPETRPVTTRHEDRSGSERKASQPQCHCFACGRDVSEADSISGDCSSCGTRGSVQPCRAGFTRRNGL